MQKVKIKDVAEIILGYSFRTSIVEDKDGDTLLVQAKDIEINDPIMGREGFVKVDIGYENKSSLLEPYDVLLLSKTSGFGEFKSTIYQFRKENFVAVSPLMIIRVKDKDKLIPHYLSLFLNSKRGQNYLSQIASGTSIKSISKKELEDFEVPLLALDKQAILCKYFKVLSEYQSKTLKKLDTYKNILESSFIC